MYWTTYLCIDKLQHPSENPPDIVGRQDTEVGYSDPFKC
jgi:hypothetical protein